MQIALIFHSKAYHGKFVKPCVNFRKPEPQNRRGSHNPPPCRFTIFSCFVSSWNLFQGLQREDQNPSVDCHGWTVDAVGGDKAHSKTPKDLFTFPSAALEVLFWQKCLSNPAVGKSQGLWLPSAEASANCACIQLSVRNSKAHGHPGCWGLKWWW